MKRLTIVPLVFLFTLIIVTSAGADWTPVNDETDIDYQTHDVRFFVSGKNWDVIRSQAPKMAYDYVETLTIGEDRKVLADVFKTRKTMSNKVKSAIKQNLHEDTGRSVTLDTGEITVYCTFSLKHVQTFFPDLNLPAPGDQ